jgi:predicted phosphodiesterase
MTYTRFIGDIHGHKYELESILRNLPDDVTSTIQVGDLGVGFGQGEYWHYSLDQAFIAANARWIRGNHDSPAICKSMTSWIQDGTVQNDTMYIGGAWSIDYKHRHAGISWWEDEELSIPQLQQCIDVYNITTPKIMVTHDCPYIAAERMFLSKNLGIGGKHQFATRTATALQTMFDSHKPDLWIFGHWHKTTDTTIEGTRFICVGELDYIDINNETLEVRMSYDCLQP